LSSPHAFVITPVYNAIRYVKASIRSVAGQTYPNLTHIVVDDYSNDGSWEWLKKELVEKKGVILVRNSYHSGSAITSIMQGINQADAGDEDVFFWVDGDDWLVDKNSIETIMKLYIRNPLTEMAYSNHVNWYGDKGKEAHLGISHKLPEKELVRYSNVAYSHLRSFKAKMLEYVDMDRLKDKKTGKYWQYCGDSALFLPMLERAKKVTFIPDVLYVYNQETDFNEWKASPEGASRCSVLVRSQTPNLETTFPPTRRFKLDHGRVCNIECKCCYYLHQKPWRNVSDKQIEQQIANARQRGDKMCDISGGEPTIAKRLPHWLDLCHKYGIFPGIITHGQDVEEKLDNLWDHGLQDILFSIHGDRAAHNDYTGTAERDGYKRLFGAMHKCKREGFKFRTNTVLTNYHDSFPQMAEDLAVVKPYISNFINFNPYHEWADQEKPNMARVSDIKHDLTKAIDILVDAGTMVNVRYVPFCMLKGYEKHIVNMFQVMFDPYEWSYGVNKTVADHVTHGEQLAVQTSGYSLKCDGCSIMGTVCNGPNKVYLESFGDEELEPYEGEQIEDRFHFRRQAEPGQLHTYLGHNFFWWQERRRKMG